jgi:hypothetical protein
MGDGGPIDVRVRDDGVVWREVDDDVLILEMETGTYLNLNGSGKLLWLALTEGISSDRLPSLLVKSYGIPEERAREDAAAFVAALQARSLVIPSR